MSETIFQCDKLSKTYYDSVTPVDVLRNVNLTVKQGERIAIIGPSGSGKSTLLHLLGGLDKPTSGHLLVNGVDWQHMKERERCQRRNQWLGFIYQFHHLLPEFSALENVAMPLLLGKYSIKIAREKATALLETVGLGHRLTHKPAQLSGGERQRVAIARALIHEPHCVLADEPTGNLDNVTANKVFDNMLALNKEFNTALIIVTHDSRMADKMDKVLVMKDGCL